MDRRNSRAAMFVGLAVIGGIAVLGIVLLLIYGETTDRTTEAAIPPQMTFGTYGQMVSPQPPTVGVSMLLRNPDRVVGEPVRVDGTISAVDRGGNWITLDAGSGRHVRVSFRDYAFVVPVDVIGRRAIVQSMVVSETLTLEERRQLAEDARAPDEVAAQLTETEVPVTIVADGVLVQD